MRIDDIIIKLSNATPNNVCSVAKDILGEFGEVSTSKLSNLCLEIKGETDYTVMLDAHIDEIHMVVTSIDSNGFLKVSTCGSIDSRVLAGCEVTVWGAEPLYGVFCTTPPHLSKGDNVASDVEDMAIDIGFDKKDAMMRVKVGDIVTFRQNDVAHLANDLIGSKSLDNRTGVAALIYVANMIKESGKNPPCNVIIQLSQLEEVGGMGAATGAFQKYPNEAVVVDVSFGDYPTISEEKTGKMCGGPMIGVSPLLDETITNNLKKIAEEKDIPYQLEVMSGRSSTNADVIFTRRDGIPSGLVSIPLRNMHTPVEVVSPCDVEDVAKLLFEYVMSKGEEK